MFKITLNKKLPYNIIYTLLIILIISIFLFFENNFLTIRDFDFFNNTVKNNLLGSFYGNRPIAPLLNYLWFHIFPLANIFFIKKYVLKIYLLLFLVVFLKLCQKINISFTDTLLAISTVSTNSFIIAFHDTLSPYFIMLIPVMLQFIFFQNIINNKKINSNLVYFYIFSLLSILCHPLTLVNTICCLWLLYKNNLLLFLYSNHKKLFWIFGIIILIVFSRVAVWLLTNKPSVTTPSELQYFGIHEHWLFVIKKYIYSYMQLFPSLIGIKIINVFPFSGIFLFVLMFRNKKQIIGNYLLFFFILFFLISASWYLILSFWAKIYTTVNIYAIGAIPFLSIYIVLFLKRRKWKFSSALILFLLIVFNIQQGITYRQESFNWKAYNVFLENNSSEIYLNPFFLAEAYNNYLNRDFLQTDKKELITDFESITDNEYYIDVIKYNELGVPLYLYDRYKYNIIKFLKDKKIEYQLYEEPTFTRFHVVKVH